MSDYSTSDAQADFAAAIQSAGLALEGAPVMDGKIHRIDVRDGRRGNRAGSYIGHLDQRPAGVVTNWQTGERVDWKAERPTQRLSPEELAAAKTATEARRAESERQRAEAHERGAARAAALWDLSRPADPEHPYLRSKGIGPGDARALELSVTGSPFGISKVLREDSPLRRNPNAVVDALVVSLRDTDGHIVNLQAILPGGEKSFLSGGKVDGGHAALGVLRDGVPIVIAEGYATAATMRDALGYPTVAAFNAGNLAPVTEAIHRRYPASPLIIAADNDHELPLRERPLPNVGLEKANAIAPRYTATVLAPPFTAEKDKGMSDWNDVARRDGIDAVRGAAAQQRVFPLSQDAQTVLVALNSELARQLPGLDDQTRASIMRGAAVELAAKEARDGVLELSDRQRGLAGEMGRHERRRELATEWVQEQESVLRSVQGTRQFFDVIHTETFELGRERLRAHYPALSDDLELSIRETRTRLQTQIEQRMEHEPPRERRKDEEKIEQLERAR